MTMKSLTGLLCALLTILLLSACGGGDPSSSAEPQSKQLQRVTKSASLTASSYQNVMEQLYLAYYGRPADPAGMTYWEGVLLAANAPTTIAGLNSAYASNPSVKTVVDSFGNSAESQTLYGTGSASTFINAIYQNVLDRSTTTDQAGATYWSGLISSGAMTQAQAALAILSAAATEPTTSNDEQVVSNRLAVANYFTAQVTAQSAGSSYSGDTASATARSMLSTVSNTTNTTAFQATVNSVVASLDNQICTPSNLTLSNYNAISLGMTLAQVSQTIGCQFDPTTTQITAQMVARFWDDNSDGNGDDQSIAVFFDPTGSKVTGISGSSNFKSATGINSSNSTGTVSSCTPANLTLANYNAISLGMTLAQVNQIIGCQFDPTTTQITAQMVAYFWDDNSDGNGDDQSIAVFFDPTGSKVTGISGSSNFKSATGI